MSKRRCAGGGRGSSSSARDQRVGGVADLAEMQIVELGYSSGQAETEGPPSTLGLPAARARRGDAEDLAPSAHACR